MLVIRGGMGWNGTIWDWITDVCRSVIMIVLPLTNHNEYRR